MSLPTPGERVDHRFHFIEHAIDDGGELRKRLIDVTVWKPLAQIAGDDALDPLVDLFDALLGAHAQPRAGQQAQAAKRRQQTQRQRLTDDMGNFPGFVDLASDHQRVAIRHSPGDRADHVGVPTGWTRPDNRNALDQIVHLEFGRKLFQIARYPVAIRAEQSGILNAPGILLQMVIDRVQPPFDGQSRENVELTGDHSVGSCDQVVDRSANR